MIAFIQSVFWLVIKIMFHILATVGLMSDSNEARYFRDNHALSYDSDLYMALQPFNEPNIRSLTANQLETLLHANISPKIPVEEDIRGINRILLDILVPIKYSTTRVDREANEIVRRGRRIHFKLEAAIDVASDSAHHFSSEEISGMRWYDHVLTLPLAFGSSLLPGLNVNKNVVDKSITKKREKRDMNCWINKPMVIAGESKRYWADFEKAKAELCEKTTGRLDDYGGLEYIIALASGANKGQFFRLDLHTKALEPISKVYNLDHISDRCGVICIGFNLIRWMRSVQPYLSQERELVEKRPSIWGGETKLTREDRYYIKKFILPANKSRDWLDVQRVLQERYMPNTARYKVYAQGKEMDISATGSFDEDTIVTLRVSPVGQQQIPATSSQLLVAVRCILEFLVEFHDCGFVHRDLRWPNILYLNNAYFIIDFETAAPSGQNITWAGQPRYYRSLVYAQRAPFQFKDDLYQVGILIGRALFMRLFESWSLQQAIHWDKFADRLRSGELSARSALAATHEYRFETIVNM